MEKSTEVNWKLLLRVRVQIMQTPMEHPAKN